MKDRKSWAIKNDAILDDLIKLVGLTDEEKELLASLQPLAKNTAPSLSDAFYTRLLAHPLTAEYIDDQIAMRKKTLEHWFLELFQGEYGQAYVQSRLRIGHIHVQIGLPIRYPLAMMDIILTHGLDVTAQSEQAEKASRAFRKLLALDSAIFNQAYEDKKLYHITELMGNETLARRILTQD